MRVRLTARNVPTLPCPAGKRQAEYWDDVLPGFALRVGAGGARTYFVRYRAGGRNRRLTIGKHPRLTLADARDRARTKLAEIAAGEDPAETRAVRRSTDTTFAALLEEVLEAKAASTREATQRERRRVADVELLPYWKDRPVASITRRDVVQLVERVARRGAPIMANRVLATVKVIFNAGIRRGFPTLEANPAALIEPCDEPRRDRYLDRDEIRIVWGATAWEAPVTRTLFRLALLTAARIGSVSALRWADIDDADVWHIPAASFKGRRPHLVPLSAEARAELEALRPLTGDGVYAFPGRADGRVPHMTSTNKALQRIRRRTGIAPWTVHDFRTTFRTHATRAEKPDHARDPAGLGVAPHVADAVLGHKEFSLGFDRYTAEPERYLLAEKRAALAKWGAFVATAVVAP